MQSNDFKELVKMLDTLRQTFLDTMQKTKMELEENIRKCVVDETVPIKSKLDTISSSISACTEFEGRLQRVEKRTVRLLGELSEKGIVKLMGEDYTEIEREFGKSPSF